MRTTLIFPPRTGPTYTPLGVACLSAVGRNCNAELNVFDANLELWNQLCDTAAPLHAMRAFSQGPLEPFLNPQTYSSQWLEPMPTARAAMNQLERLARHYLAGDGLERELEILLSRQAAKIARNTPETVAYSTMFLDQLPFVLSSAKFLKEERDAAVRVVIGGAAMSALFPAELLEAAQFVDAVLTGEGEIAFERLLSGNPFSQIPGCYYRENGKIEFTGKPMVPDDLSQLPIPDFSGLKSAEYFNPLPVLPIYGGRGCKWRRCRFCAHNQSFGKYRERPAMATALEMQTRRTFQNCRHFYLVDQYVDPVYLNDLCDAILSLGLDCRFQIMARTIGEYTPALLHKAAKAGCCWISWGMESGSQNMLNIMNKGTDVATSQSVIRNAAEEGISNLLMMIFGAPGSNEIYFEESCRFLEQVWNDIDGMTASAFVLFDQTDFGRRPGLYGLDVLGRNPILDVSGRPIYDMKLPFRRESEDGRFESSLAAKEIEQWERRKVWLPPLPFHGRLCCEHYLLYADAKQASFRPNSRPRSA